MKKRLFFLVIAFISAVAANADKDFIQGILQYHCFDENMTAEVRLSDYNDTQEVDVVIPEQIEVDGKTYTVTSIADNAFPYPMTGISMPSTIKRIGRAAFQYLPLRSISYCRHDYFAFRRSCANFASTQYLRNYQKNI